MFTRGNLLTKGCYKMVPGTNIFQYFMLTINIHVYMAVCRGLLSLKLLAIHDRSIGFESIIF